MIRWLKPIVFLACLAPLARLAWKAYSGNLGANPIEVITHSTGDWTLIFLLVTLSVTPLRKLTNNEEIVVVNAATINEAIKELQARFPGIQERLMDEKGEVRRFINVYLNEEDIRFLQNQSTALKDGDEISIIPAIAGG